MTFGDQEIALNPQPTDFFSLAAKPIKIQFNSQVEHYTPIAKCQMPTSAFEGGGVFCWNADGFQQEGGKGQKS